MAFKWTSENCLNLIDNYRQHPCIWNPKNVKYKCRESKNDAWNAVCSAVGCLSQEEAKRKIRNLVAQFYRERKKYRSMKKSGAGAHFHSKWFAYDALVFLRDKNKVRPCKESEAENVILLNILLTLSVVLCEFPPPYPSGGFKPSQPFSIPSRNPPQRLYNTPRPVFPQTQYGVPNVNDINPVKVLVRPSEFGNNLAQRQQYASISQKYQSSAEVDFRNHLKIVNGELQVMYGIPSKQELPRVQYGLPYNEYHVPRPTENKYQNTIKQANNQLQISYGLPNRINQPQSQYGAPDTKNIETFEKTQVQTQLEKINELTNSHTVQYLPSKEATVFRNSDINRNSELRLPIRQAINFRNEAIQPSEQYLPKKVAADFRSAYEQSQYSSSIRNPIVGQTTSISNTDNSRNVNFQYVPPEDTTRSNFNSQYVESNDDISQPKYVPSQHSNPTKVTLLNNFDVTPYQVPNQNSENENPLRYYNSRPNNVGNQFESNSRNNIYTTSNQPSNENRGNTVEIPNKSSGSNGQQSQYPLQKPGIRNVDITQVKVKAWSFDANENNNKPELSVVNPTHTGDQSDLGEDKVTDRYLPPTTTGRSTIQKPSRPSPTPVSTSRPTQDTEETTETNEQSDNPNVAIATAVAGGPGEQQFYLLQPDGRFQRVLYQRTREEGDREYEYTANYHFQNIQADPNIVYTPLISLG